MSFDILEHWDALTPDGGSNDPRGDHSFHCPACDAPNFKVNIRTGKWGTFSCDCANSEDGKRRIRDALSPAINPNPITQAAKPPRPKQERHWDYFTPITLAANQPAITVNRWDDPDQPDGNGWKNGRKINQTQRVGKPKATYQEVAAKVLPYGLTEAKQALTDGAPFVLFVEGEPCVDACRAVGIPAICNLGGSGKFDPERDGPDRTGIPPERLVVTPDRDQPGLKHAKQVAAAYPGCQWLFPFPGTPEWNGACPARGGLDIADWIEHGATIEQIINAITPHPESPAPKQPEPPTEAASVADVVTEANLAASLTLDPLALIGGELGQAIANRAERLHVPASVLINGLLPVAASQLPRAVSVLLSEDSEYSQPPILWSLSVAPTGSNKSETSDVAVKPLYRFQDDLPPDQERSFYTSSFTLPGLARVQAAQPDRGCLINPDELSGFVRNLQNEQARGRGDELSRMLSIYDGRPLRGNFSDKALNYQLKGSSFSLLSTIQPSVLLECMGDLDDASGLWARFNLCEIPAKRRRITRTGRSGDGLMPALQAAYLCLQQWEPRTYGLTDEAAELFDTFYDACEDQRLDQTLQPALQAYAAKQEGRCGRIALVLHCLQAAASKTPPTHLISADTMLGAITICDFYQQQLRRFYTLALAQVSESLEGNALLVFEFIKREAGKPCTVRQINKGPRALRRMTTKQIEESLAALTQQNLIRQSGDAWYLTTV